MNRRDVERLKRDGEQAALDGARDYASARDCDINAKRLGEELQRRIETTLPGAMELLEATRGRMGHDALAAFNSTMRLVGINAAREVDSGRAKVKHRPRPFRR